VALLRGFLVSLYKTNEWPPVTKATGEFVWVCSWLALFSAGFLALAFISFVAGLDLWKLKNRGRNLASVSMILLLLPGIVFLLLREELATWEGAAICAFSVFSLVYLQLPSIRRSFVPPPPDIPR
jgi:uncharacterized membrane protein (DUF2068 family)